MVWADNSCCSAVTLIHGLDMRQVQEIALIAVIINMNVSQAASWFLWLQCAHIFYKHGCNSFFTIHPKLIIDQLINV